MYQVYIYIYVCISRFKSIHSFEKLIYTETEAKKVLSLFAFAKIFVSSFFECQKLQVVQRNDEFVTWPMGMKIEQAKYNQMHKFSNKYDRWYNYSYYL